MSALDNARAENEALRNRMNQRAKNEKKQRHVVVREAVGQAGQLTGAVATAVVDAKFAAAPGDMATFGKSKVPAAPTVGFLVALGSLALVKASPLAATFLGRTGMESVYIGIYQGARNKAAEFFADDDD